MKLYDNDSNEELGVVTKDQLQDLVDLLEEEHSEDRDYYITSHTIAMLQEKGADEDLIEMLREALGGRGGVEVRWEDE